MAGNWAVDVPATHEGLLRSRDALEQFCASERLPTAERWPLQIVLDEIISNIVRHAAAKGPVAVRVTFGRQGDTIRLEIEDDGPPFDPLAFPKPDLTAGLDQRSPGGLGITLVRGLVDRIEYRRGERNLLTLTRRVAGATRGV